MTDRLASKRPIVVLGLPSGGTSAVAGVLYCLGTNMGELSRMTPGQGNHRPYPTYECAELRRLVDGSRGNWAQVARDVGCYATGRSASHSPRVTLGGFGFKHPALCYLGKVPGAASWLEGCDIIDVRRDVQTTKVRNAYYRQRDTDSYVELMADLREVLLERYPAKHTVRYEDLIESPRYEIDALRSKIDEGGSGVRHAVALIENYERPETPNLNTKAARAAARAR